VTEVEIIAQCIKRCIDTDSRGRNGLAGAYADCIESRSKLIRELTAVAAANVGKAIQQACQHRFST
jgi:hypothetical protein